MGNQPNIFCSHAKSSCKHEHSLRILILGDSCVGKTSIIKNILGSKFNPTSVVTLSYQFYYHQVNNTKYTFIDTSGIQKFMYCLSPTLVSSADIILFVCDNTAESVQALYEWNQFITPYLTTKQLKFLLINKRELHFNYDLEEQLEQLSQNLQIMNHELVSAKEDEQLSNIIFKMIQSKKISQFNSTTISNHRSQKTVSDYEPIVVEYYE